MRYANRIVLHLVASVRVRVAGAVAGGRQCPLWAEGSQVELQPRDGFERHLRVGSDVEACVRFGAR